MSPADLFFCSQLWCHWQCLHDFRHWCFVGKLQERCLPAYLRLWLHSLRRQQAVRSHLDRHQQLWLHWQQVHDIWNRRRLRHLQARLLPNHLCCRLHRLDRPEELHTYPFRQSSDEEAFAEVVRALPDWRDCLPHCRICQLQRLHRLAAQVARLCVYGGRLRVHGYDHRYRILRRVRINWRRAGLHQDQALGWCRMLCWAVCGAQLRTRLCRFPQQLAVSQATQGTDKAEQARKQARFVSVRTLSHSLAVPYHARFFIDVTPLFHSAL